MGRRKNVPRHLQTGQIYSVDRRFERLGIYNKVLSRQWSRNHSDDNFTSFFIRDAPINTTVMVTKIASFFGKEYVKVIAANSDQEVLVGWITQKEFLDVICGLPVWKATRVHTSFLSSSSAS